MGRDRLILVLALGLTSSATAEIDHDRFAGKLAQPAPEEHGAPHSDCSGRDENANALLRIGDQHYEAEEYDQAERAWLRVKRDYPDSAAWVKAMLNLGRLHKKAGGFDRAIGCYSVVGAVLASEAESGTFRTHMDRVHLPQTKWEIGHCLLAQKKYREALEAYRLVEMKYPFPLYCGNAYPEYVHRYAFHKAVCYDFLGDTRAAVRLYYKGISEFHFDPLCQRRIVDAYEAAGQREDLRELIDEIDAAFAARIGGAQGENDIDEQLMQLSPAFTMRRMLEIRDLEAKKDWESLISLITTKGRSEASLASARRGQWEVGEAARILGRHADETVSLLIAQVDRLSQYAKDNGVTWVYFTLGCCGTDEAVTFLKDAALKENSSRWMDSIVYALGMAGDKGEDVLAELELVADGRLKKSIARYRQKKRQFIVLEIEFPAHHSVPPLPKTLQELTMDGAEDPDE